MELGELLGLFLQSFIVQICSKILSVAIFVIVYGRMMEIYLMTSLAPIPFSTFGNREQSHIGQNYLRALMALGFQGFLIMICIAIYAVLVQTVAFSDDIIGSIWVVLGYTVLLCFLALQDRVPCEIRYECPLKKRSKMQHISPSRGILLGSKTKVIFKPHEEAAHLLRTGGTHRCAVILFDQERRFNESCGYEHDHHYDPHVSLGNV